MLNWYPKIQAMKSGGVVGGDADAAPNQAHLTARHVAFLDLDRALLRAGALQGRARLVQPEPDSRRASRRCSLTELVRLLIPAEELAFDSFEKVRLWEEIALALLKKYTERYYTFRKREWELPHLEYRDLDGDDPNFLGVKESTGRGLLPHPDRRVAGGDRRQAEELKAAIETGDLKPWEFRGIKAIWFGQHLYRAAAVSRHRTSSRSAPRR